MASVVGKRINGRTYYYLAESRRVDGKPRIVAQRYLGTAADIADAVAALPDGVTPGSALPGGGVPERTRHLAFGDVAAVWGVLTDLGLADLVDEIVGSRRTKVSTGTYVAIGVLHQVVASGAGLGLDGVDLADWWCQTAAARFVRPRLDAAALDRRRIWRAMRHLTSDHLDQLEEALLPRLLAAVEPHDAADAWDRRRPVGRRAADTSREAMSLPVLAVDVPAFAAYESLSPANGSGGPDASLAGLGLIVTLDGAIPLVSDLYRHRAGTRPDTPADTFTTLVRRLAARHLSLLGTQPPDADAEADPARDREDAGAITVVVDAGQSSQLGGGGLAGLHVVASLPPGDHPELLAVPGSRRRAVDPARFPGVTAFETRIRVGGVDRRAIALHSRLLYEAQARGLAQDLASATRRLEELAAALRNGTLRLPRERVTAEIARITRFRWVDRVLSTTLTGNDPADLRLRWSIDEAARARLAQEVFSRQLLVTDHDDWSVADVLTAYRARHRIEGTLRHWGGPVVPTPSPGWRWDDQRIAVHSYVRILATTVTHLMRHTAQRNGLDLSVRELFDRLAGIEETELRYRSRGGRPRMRRLLADRDTDQERLFELFGLARYAPTP
jgi:hypothetical protein